MSPVQTAAAAGAHQDVSQGRPLDDRVEVRRLTGDVVAGWDSARPWRRLPLRPVVDVVGVVVGHPAIDTATDVHRLLARADVGLYRADDQGRNKVGLTTIPDADRRHCLLNRLVAFDVVEHPR